MTSFATINARELDHIDPHQGLILDVRTKMEHAEKHVEFAHAHVPLDELNPTDLIMRHGLDKDADIYILCRSGKRAAQAAEKFVAEGFRNVKVVEGGIIACEDCGHSIKGHGAGVSANGAKTKGPISLERQVRIAAGLLAATGAALGLLISPVFTIIPLFVGGGLIFAGVTDRCGMALVLTKAPWNKMADTACASAACRAPSSGGGNCAGTSTAPASEKIGQSCQ